MIAYLLYRLGIFLAVRLPLKASYRIAVFIADCHFRISKKDREAVLDNLDVILDGSDDSRTRAARAVFRNFAKYLIDFFRFAKIDEGYIKKYVKIRNIESLDRALKKGNGVIIASAHIGNWELAGAIVARLGYKLNVIALDHRNRLVNSVFIGQRSSMGVKVISIGIALKECFKALKRNELLALLGDRDFSAHGIHVTFFGKETLVPKGPATFCERTGAAIVPCFLVRDEDDTFTIYFEDEITHKPTGDSERDIRDITEKLSGVIEDYIRRYPDQWYLFRRVWS